MMMHSTNNDKEMPLEEANDIDVFSVKSRTKKRFRQLMSKKWRDEDTVKNESTALTSDETELVRNGHENEGFLKDETQVSSSERLPPLDSASIPRRKSRRRKKRSDDLLELMGNPLEEVSPAATVTPVKDETVTQLLEKSIETREDELVAIHEESLTDDGQILAIVVHCTDRLSLDLLVSHPMVRIHIFDMESGLYLKKRNVERAVSSYYETNRIDYILPIMTQPFNISNKRSLVPTWEEMVVFNEPFTAFVQEEPRVLILFEVLDFIKPSSSPLHVSQKAQKLAKKGGWYRIAWAFLKPCGKNGVLNTGKKVRLQLFRPSNKFSANPSISQVYRWWKKQQRVRYPATLYVTVKPYLLPEHVQPALRSMLPLQEECSGNTATDHLQGFSDNSQRIYSSSTILKSPGGRTIESIVEWGRLGDQTCKVPKTKLATLPSAKKGCFVLKFSCNGRYLACGCCSSDGAFVSLFQIPSCQHVQDLRGHQGIIYDLDWSTSDQTLLSASADSTVRVYTIGRTGSQLAVILPHPSYLYTASFHPSIESLVVTAGYDHVVRIWALGSNEGHLLQELEGHTTAVNASCWDAAATKLLTADSSGLICIWNCPVFISNGDTTVNWTLAKEIRIKSFKNQAICSMSLQKTGRKLLMQTTSGALSIVDLKVEIVVHQLRSSWAGKRFSKSCISPCGSLVFAGAERGSLCVWNAHTGDELYMYQDLPYQSLVSCVQYHPHDHMLAVCAPDGNAPILIYAHKFIPGREADDQPVKLKAPSVTSSSRASEWDVESTLRFHKVIKQLDSVLNYESAVHSSRSSLLTPSCQKQGDRSSQILEIRKECDDQGIDDERFSAVISKTGQLEIVSGSDEQQRTPNRSARQQRRSKRQVHQAQVHVSGTADS